MKPSRRKLSQLLSVGSAVTLISLPNRWSKPVVNSILLPSHGAVSTISLGSESTTSEVVDAEGFEAADVDIAVFFDCNTSVGSVVKGIWPANGLNIPADAVFGLDLDIDSLVETPVLLWANIGPGANWGYESGDITEKQKDIPPGSYEIIAASKVCEQRIKVSFDVAIARISADSVIERATLSEILITIL